MSFAVLVIALCASNANAETGTLLPPTGPYGVGRAIFHWKDSSHDEVLSPRPGDKRELGVWLWYPAIKDEGKPAALYVDSLDALAPYLPSDEVSVARSVHTHAVEDATVASSSSPFPILIFSPGAGSLPALYTSILEDLASHGYVVVAIDHPYDDIAVPLSDRRIAVQIKAPSEGEELLHYERFRIDERTKDIHFVVDKLYSIRLGSVASPLKGHLDLERIGVFGHSIGGLTAANACIVIPRIRACANLDGLINALPVFRDLAYPYSYEYELTKPFLFIEKTLPAIPGEAPEDAQRRLAVLHESGDALIALVKSGRSYRMTVDGATRATFSDEEIIMDANALRSRELLDVTRTYLRAFFDEALNDKDGAVLDNPPTDVAAHIEVFTPAPTH